MRCVFLDIDGVLNSKTAKGPYVSDMEEGKLFLLRQLLEMGCCEGVVITSDRRLTPLDLQEKIDAFTRYGIAVLGQTRDPEFEDTRGKQILDYLEEEEDIDRILILDDQDDGISAFFCEDFVQVNPYYGFDNEAFGRALAILSR